MDVVPFFFRNICTNVCVIHGVVPAAAALTPHGQLLCCSRTLTVLQLDPQDPNWISVTLVLFLPPCWVSGAC